MKPKHFFFMVNMASSIAHGHILSLTMMTTVSHQHGNLSHARLVNIRSHKGSHQLNDIGYSYQLTTVKIRNPLTSIPWPYHGLRGCLLDDGVVWDGAPRKKACQIGQLMHCSLHLCNFMWETHFMVTWQLSKQGICWPVSHDYIMGSSVELTEVTCFLKFTTGQVMDFHWIAGSIFTNY